ncbi:MAG: hypothetical protein ACRCV5_16500 [Afipia sp.]
MADLDELSDELVEMREHADVIRAVHGIMQTRDGRNFLRYVFKNLEVAELPAIGMTGELLADKLGFLRAGNSIYKLAMQADSAIAAEILAQVEKDRYDELLAALRAQDERK